MCIHLKDTIHNHSKSKLCILHRHTSKNIRFLKIRKDQVSYWGKVIIQLTFIILRFRITFRTVVSWIVHKNMWYQLMSQQNIKPDKEELRVRKMVKTLISQIRCSVRPKKSWNMAINKLKSIKKSVKTHL